MIDDPPRVILTDDHVLMAEGLKSLLQPHCAVVGVAHSGSQLLTLLETVAADVVLLDLSMPGRSGLDVLPDLRARHPDLKVLVLTMHVDRMLCDTVMAAGAHGFVPKDSEIVELVAAIHEVHAGRRYVSPRVPDITSRVSLGTTNALLAPLTPRQMDIIRLIGQGKSTQEIAESLGLSAWTITFHRKNLRKVLGLDSEWSLTRYAILATAQSGGATVAPGTPEP